MSSRLRNFHRRDRNLHQFSCPICGDSKKDRRKARGYAFETPNGMRIYCHKCGFSKTFVGFLKEFDYDLYREYLLDRFADERPVLPDYDAVAKQAAAETVVPKWFGTEPLSGLQRLSELPPTHEAVRYASLRGLPRSRWPELYHTDDFPAWANTLIPGRYNDKVRMARLVVPFYARYDRELIGFQGRAYDPRAKSKYLTASLTKEHPFLFGWDKVNANQDVIVVEGPFDSMFLSNAIATAGGSLIRELARLGRPASSFVVAYDNEPRSVTTVEKIKRASIDFPVFIWPGVVYDKDFNDMYLRLVSEGKSDEKARELIMDMVRSRTYTDLHAELEINLWSRCSS